MTNHLRPTASELSAAIPRLAQALQEAGHESPPDSIRALKELAEGVPHRPRDLDAVTHSSRTFRRFVDRWDGPSESRRTRRSPTSSPRANPPRASAGSSRSSDRAPTASGSQRSALTETQLRSTMRAALERLLEATGYLLVFDEFGRLQKSTIARVAQLPVGTAFDNPDGAAQRICGVHRTEQDAARDRLTSELPTAAGEQAVLLARLGKAIATLARLMNIDLKSPDVSKIPGRYICAAAGMIPDVMTELMAEQTRTERKQVMAALGRAYVKDASLTRLAARAANIRDTSTRALRRA